MIKPKHLREAVIRPTLKAANLWCPDAEELLIGTAAQETLGGYYLIQENNEGIYYKGGLGIYEMEGPTHDGLWRNRIESRPLLKSAILRICNFSSEPNKNELITNLAYATLMTRIFYTGIEQRLPSCGDVDAMARYWKRHYNTVFGSGTVEQFVDNYHKYIKS